MKPTQWRTKIYEVILPSACRHLFQAKALWSIETADTSAAASAASYTDVPRMFHELSHLRWPLGFSVANVYNLTAFHSQRLCPFYGRFLDERRQPTPHASLKLSFWSSWEVHHESFKVKSSWDVVCQIASWYVLTKKTSLNVLKRPVNVLKSWRVYSVLHYFSNSPAVAVDQRT